MAEEKEVEKKKSGKSPMMMILVGLVVVLLLAMGGIGYFMYSKGLFSDEPMNSATPVAEKQMEVAKEEVGENIRTKRKVKCRGHGDQASYSNYQTERLFKNY